MVEYSNVTQQSVTLMENAAVIAQTVNTTQPNETDGTRTNETTVPVSIGSMVTHRDQHTAAASSVDLTTQSTSTTPMEGVSNINASMATKPKQIQVTVPQQGNANLQRSVHAQPFVPYVPLYRTNPETMRLEKVLAVVAAATQQIIDASMQQSIPVRVMPA